MMELPACQMLMFQGVAFEDENYKEAISVIWKNIKEYDPAEIGYVWAEETGPKIQLEPKECRGYMEGRPVQLNR